MFKLRNKIKGKAKKLIKELETKNEPNGNLVTKKQNN